MTTPAASHDACPERMSGTHVLALLAEVVACRLLTVHSFPIYDDAFITFRYARNLAAGAGLVYNPGQPWEPILGTTTPGYAVLLGGLAWLGFGIENASRGLNIACDVLTALILIRLFQRRPLVSSLVVVTFAAFPVIGRISVGGMEAPLLVALAMGAVLAGHERRLLLAGLLAGLACTVRPEAVILVAVLLVAHVRSGRDLARFAAPVAVVGLVYVALLTSVYGTPIPQSVRAKAAEGGRPFAYERTKDILAQAFGPTMQARWVFPVVALGFARSLFWPVRPFVLFSMAMVLGYVLSGAKTWGWYFYVPLVAWSVGLGLGTDLLLMGLWTRVARTRLRPLATHVPMVAAAAAVTAAATFSHVLPDRVTPEVYEPMRRWAEERGLRERNASIVASDIGAIGWYGGLILDTEGLVWPEGRDFEHQIDVVRAHRPDYVVVVVRRDKIVRFMADPLFTEYRPVQRFNTTGDRTLEPVAALLPHWWEQDYLVYERID
jgi:hypothetical protein